MIFKEYKTHCFVFNQYIIEMAIKNKRIIVQEAELVDNAEVELVDLLSSSSKAEKAILDLCDKCLSFKNQEIKTMALQLKSRAASLTQALSNLQVTGNVNDIGGEKNLDAPVDNQMQQGNDSRNMNDEGDKQRLDMPEAAPIIESAKDRYLKRKKLKEADLELEAEDKSADEEIAKEEKVISDNTYDKPDIKEEGESIPEGKIVIDLSEPFENVVKGLDQSEFEAFKHDVISHLEGAIDPIEQKKDSMVADQFTKSIEALNASQSVEDFDLGMDQIYDFADENDILVETIIRK